MQDRIKNTPVIVLPAYTNRNAFPLGIRREDGAFDVIGEITGIGGTAEEDRSRAEYVARACNAFPAALRILRRVGKVLNWSDSTHPDFRDSCADCIEELWFSEAETRELLAQIGGEL